MGRQLEKTGAPSPEESKVPTDGWKAELFRNSILCEHVDQLPVSSTIVLPGQSTAKATHEWHFLVHGTAPLFDEPYAGEDGKCRFRVGDRVIVNGQLTAVRFNDRDWYIVPMHSVQAVLQREDGKLFVGSKYAAEVAADKFDANKYRV